MNHPGMKDAAMTDLTTNDEAMRQIAMPKIVMPEIAMPSADARPFVLQTDRSRDDLLPPAFRAELVTALRDGTIAVEATKPDEMEDLASMARLLRDPTARTRSRGRGPIRHDLLIDWQLEESVIALAGLVPVDRDQSGPRNPEYMLVDGTPVPGALAIAAMDRVCTRIAIDALSQPAVALRSTPGTKDVLELMIACAVASYQLAPGEAMSIACSTPWKPASMRVVSSKAAGRTIEMDPRLEVLLPFGMMAIVASTGQEGQEGRDTIRLDQLSTMVSFEKAPDTMAVARTIMAGQLSRARAVEEARDAARAAETQGHGR